VLLGVHDKVLFFILSSFSAAQRRPGRSENILPGIGATVAHPDTARGDAHLRGDFQQLQPDGVGLGFAHSVLAKPNRRKASTST